MLNNAPQMCVHIAAQTVKAVFRKEQAAEGSLCGHLNKQHVAVGLEQPAAHFHNRKGQCCGSRDFRDATQSILGDLCALLLYLLTGLHVVL